MNTFAIGTLVFSSLTTTMSIVSRVCLALNQSGFSDVVHDTGSRAAGN